uniref:Uncharacterized protein n=1 Tax=Anguilla anguilla TaxID=7936 RepID=A0A0E9XV43_ANGAN
MCFIHIYIHIKPALICCTLSLTGVICTQVSASSTSTSYRTKAQHFGS